MYSTVDALLGLWGPLIAGRVQLHDATAEVQALLDKISRFRGSRILNLEAQMRQSGVVVPLV
jgi:hypothetical protein